MPAPRGGKVRLALAVAATVIWWAASPVGIHAALEPYAPVYLAALRFVIASATVLPLLLLLRVRLPRLGDLPRIALLGLFSITFHHLALNFGQRRISVGAASVLAQSSPLFTALISVIVLRQRASIVLWLGILLGFAGAALVVVGGGKDVKLDIGGLLILAAALSWAIYFTLQKPMLAKYRPAERAAYAILAGTIPLLPFLPPLAEIKAASTGASIAVVYLGIFPSALAYFTWAMVLKEMPVVRASAFLYLAPPLATLMGFALFNEVPTMMTLVGGALTIAAVALVNARRAEPSRAEPPGAP